MRKMWPVLAALVVLTSACRLETNVTINVAEDGSGSFITELGLDDEMRGVLESFGGGDDLLAGLDLGDGTPTETRTEGDMTFISATQTFPDIASLESVIAANQDQASFDVFDLNVDDDGARLVAKTGALADGDTVDPGALPFDPSTLTDDVFSANIFVKLPGSVTTHNADEVMSDGTLRWAISLTEPIDIAAETSFGGGGVPWLPIGVGALALVGVGAFMAARRKGDTAAGALAATPEPPAPMGFGEPASPASDPFGATTLPPDLPPELPPQT